tara:strand:+ start:88 stop:216 length:129 start_codon:yes stop_codon:yes gene_type:complete
VGPPLYGGSGAITKSTSKGAITLFSRGLEKEVCPKNLRVNSL